MFSSLNTFHIHEPTVPSVALCLWVTSSEYPVISKEAENLKVLTSLSSGPQGEWEQAQGGDSERLEEED